MDPGPQGMSPSSRLSSSQRALTARTLQVLESERATWRGRNPAEGALGNSKRQPVTSSWRSSACNFKIEKLQHIDNHIEKPESVLQVLSLLLTWGCAFMELYLEF